MPSSQFSSMNPLSPRSLTPADLSINLSASNANGRDRTKLREPTLPNLPVQELGQWEENGIRIDGDGNMFEVDLEQEDAPELPLLPGMEPR